MSSVRLRYPRALYLQSEHETLHWESSQWVKGYVRKHNRACLLHAVHSLGVRSSTKQVWHMFTALCIPYDLPVHCKLCLCDPSRCAELMVFVSEHLNNKILSPNDSLVRKRQWS